MAPNVGHDEAKVVQVPPIEPTNGKRSNQNSHRDQERRQCRRGVLKKHQEIGARHQREDAGVGSGSHVVIVAILDSEVHAVVVLDRPE